MTECSVFVVIIVSLFTRGINNLPLPVELSYQLSFARFTVHYLVLFAHLLSLSNNISSSFTL